MNHEAYTLELSQLRGREARISVPSCYWSGLWLLLAIDSSELEACFVPGRAASPGLRKWPWGTERQVLTVGSLQIKPEGYAQKPVSVASATWTAEIYFSCYDMKVGFHL